MIVSDRYKIHKIKKGHIALAIMLVLSLITTISMERNASAATLARTLVRYDRLQTSSYTSGTVCATPTTAATEASVRVTFPTGFTVSGTTANWTVSTTNTGWPSGATAWLGINTATAVASQDVTFPSTDLVVGTLYCFNWTNNSVALLTASGASNTNLTTVTTRTSAPATIDSGEALSSTIADDTIDVSATVPQAFSFALSANSDALGTLSTSSVAVSPTPRTVTVNTNAKNGWLVWGKDTFGGLCALSVGTCNTGSTTTQLNTTATGSNRTLSAGTSDVNLGVATTAGTVDTAFVYSATPGRGGGLSASAYQTLVSGTTPVSNGVITLRYQVAIDGVEAAATDYTDTVILTGAGLF